jgi:hypothetical protein
MFEPTKREFDDDVQRSIDMFERAKVGDAPAIEPLVPRRLLLALDGSSQDAMGRRIARRLKRRFGCDLDVVDGRQGDASSTLTEQVAEELNARALPRSAGESFEQILAAIDRSQCDLLIVPSPFERDLATVGTDSTGTVIDVLISRSSVPLLVVRESYEVSEEPFARVFMVLVGENEAAQFAARWATGLVAPGGWLELMLLLETEIYENVRDLIRSLDPAMNVSQEKLADAMQRSRVRLHRALQKAAQQTGFQYSLDLQQGVERSSNETKGGERYPLTVLALEKSDHLSQGFVHDRIRHSAGALLVVPQQDRSAD